MNRIKPESIADVKHIIEISQLTGEIIEYDRTVLTEEAVTKQREVIEFKKSQNEMHSYIRNNIGNFFFYFYNKIDKIDILPQYKLRFLYIASYLNYDGGELVNKYKGNGNINVRLDRTKLYDLLKLSDSEFMKTMRILSANNLVRKDGRFYNLNTEYCIKGKANNVKHGCTRVFIENIRSLYESTKPLNHKRLYYIFRLLPYINLQYNIVCNNPQEEAIQNISYLNMEDICAILKTDITNRSKLYNDLRKFTIADNYVICKSVIDGEEFIVINPKLYYAGTKIDELKFTMELFDMIKSKKKSRKSMPLATS